MMKMDIFALLVLLLLFWIEGGEQLKLSPEKLTVLRGEEARLTCSPPNTRWIAMVWLLNGTTVLTISKEHGLLPSTNPNVTAEKNPVSSGDSWDFILKHTERHNQGQVTCDLQGIDRKTASLFVQEKGSVEVFGDSMMAFKGQSAWFECRAEGWYPQPSVQWQVNDKKVSQAEFNVSHEESGRNLFTVKSNLSLTAARSSDVACLASVSALPTPLRSSTRLTVVAEVLQEREECTVPLAVTASLSVLLLLLLCICIVLWFRQWRQASKPNPQRERRFDLSSRDFGAEVPEGKVNLAFSSESSTDAAFNEQTTETHSCMGFSSFHKVPDVVSSSTLSLHTESQAQECVSEESLKNVRRITTV